MLDFVLYLCYYYLRSERDMKQAFGLIALTVLFFFPILSDLAQKSGGQLTALAAVTEVAANQ